jgi:hypothetical protein
LALLGNVQDEVYDLGVAVGDGDVEDALAGRQRDGDVHVCAFFGRCEARECSQDEKRLEMHLLELGSRSLRDPLLYALEESEGAIL